MRRLFSPVVQCEQEDTSKNLYMLSDAIEEGELADDMINYENEIADSIEQLQILSDVHSKLEKQADLNQELLDQAMAAAIKDDQLKASQHVLITSMEQLKYSIKDIRTANISIESINNPYLSLTISQENILDLIKDVCGKTLDVIGSVYDKLKSYAVKIKQFLINKERMLNSLEVIIRENENVDIEPLETKKAEYVSKKFCLLLRIEKGNLDMKEIIEFVKGAQSNPLLDKIEDIYTYMLHPDENEDTRHSVIQQALQDSKASELHQRALEYANSENSTLKHKALFVLSVIQNKMVCYCDNVDKQTKEKDPSVKDKRSLGITKESLKVPNEAVQFKYTEDYKKVQDLLPLINEIRGLSRGANGYLDKLLRANRTAYDTVKKATSGMKQDALAKSFKNIIGSNGLGGWAKQALSNIWHGVSIKYEPEDEENAWKYIPDPTRDALNIIKEIGNNSVYEMMSNYYKNVSNLADAVKLLVDSTRLKNGW